MVLEKVGCCLTHQTTTAERKLGYLGHIMRHLCLEKNIVEGMVGGKKEEEDQQQDDIKQWAGFT